MRAILLMMVAMMAVTPSLAEVLAARNGVAIKSAPSASAPVIDRADKDHVFEVVAFDGEWATVRHGAGTAFVTADDIVATVVYANTNEVYIYPRPDMAARHLGSVDVNYGLIPVSYSDEWTEIKMSSGTGYVRSVLLSLYPQQATAVTAPRQNNSDSIVQWLARVAQGINTRGTPQPRSTAPALASGVYKVSVTRKDRDLYRVDSTDIYIVTKYCYEYVYSDAAVLRYEQYAMDNKLIFSGGASCQVEKVI